MFKNLLGIKDLSREDIEGILAEATQMKRRLMAGDKAMDTLRGKSVMTLFYENSTRTRVSFENAGKFLGAVTNSISVVTSSVQKGETLVDTAKTIDSLNTDLVIIRHGMAGTPKILADSISAKVINAGDGMHEHPTQALLDMLTMQLHFDKLDGLKIAIVGDIKHSRVARSNIWGLSKFDTDVRVFAPSTLRPLGLEQMPCRVCKTLEEAVCGADVIMGLRIQTERQQKGLFPSLGEYAKFYGVNSLTMLGASEGAVIMHPGPVNRNVELADEVIDAEYSLINQQVNNGLAVRMALLKIMLA